MNEERTLEVNSDILLMEMVDFQEQKWENNRICSSIRKGKCKCCDTKIEHNKQENRRTDICRSCQIGNHTSNCSKPYGAQGIKAPKYVSAEINNSSLKSILDDMAKYIGVKR